MEPQHPDVAAQEKSFDSVRRYAELFTSRGRKYLILNGVLWFRDTEVVKAWGPANAEHRLNREACRQILKKLGGQMILMTDGVSSGADRGWYAVICDKFTSMEQMDAKNRSEVRRGLKNCVSSAKGNPGNVH